MSYSEYEPSIRFEHAASDLVGQPAQLKDSSSLSDAERQELRPDAAPV